MAKIVAVANRKDGAGKSTLTINLAAALQGMGIPTAILDIDAEQQAASRWRDAREAERPEVEAAVHTRLQRAIAQMEKNGAAMVLIDCPALLESATSEAVKVADLVLTPCRTTVQDIQYLEDTRKIIEAHGKPSAVVFNAVKVQLNETDQARAYMEKHGIAIAPAHMSEAVAYHRAITAGLGVTEREPSSKAAQEMTELAKWVASLMELSHLIDIQSSNTIGLDTSNTQAMSA